MTGQYSEPDAGVVLVVDPAGTIDPGRMRLNIRVHSHLEESSMFHRARVGRGLRLAGLAAFMLTAPAAVRGQTASLYILSAQVEATTNDIVIRGFSFTAGMRVFLGTTEASVSLVDATTIRAHVNLLPTGSFLLFVFQPATGQFGSFSITIGATGPTGPPGPPGPPGPVAPAHTRMLTFQEPEAAALMTTSGTYSGSGIPYVISFSLPSITLPGAVFTPIVPAVNGGTPFVYLQMPYNSRIGPSPDDFVVDGVLRIASRALRISFDQPTRFFGFGASLNATSSPADMSVELFDRTGQSLGVYAVHLRRTVLSRFGATNSNSEGAFHISGVGEVASVLITNKGDGVNANSQWHWTLDNLTFDAP